MSSPIALPDPFGLTADPDGYVPRPATEEALAALLKTLREGRRPAALLGPPGLGKTLLQNAACSSYARGCAWGAWARPTHPPACVCMAVPTSQTQPCVTPRPPALGA